MNTQLLTKNRIISILIPLLLTVSLAFAGILAGGRPVNAASGVWTGSGTTAANPYIISDAADLATLVTNVNSGTNYAGRYFRLAADINLSSYAWVPIGNNITNPFSGTFDGNGRIIRNLSISASTTDYVGLFGCMDGVVKNLGIVSCTIYGNKSVGGVVGYNLYGTVENCYTSSTISGVNGIDNVGGVVGANYGTVKNCYNTGIINGSNLYTGGVVGANYGTVENCYNTGAVRGTGEVGGVVGRSIYDYTASLVTNCYNTGAISGAEYIGGVVGANYMGTVRNCYSAGSVSGARGIGGVIGYNYYGTSTNCHYNNESYSGNGIGTNVTQGNAPDTTTNKTVADMTSAGFATTLGAAFEKRAADTNYCYYPELKVFKTDGSTTAQDASKSSVTVTRRTPTLKSSPTVTAITYGQSLNASTLSSGSVADPITGDTISGTFTWDNGSTTYPAVFNSNNTDYTYSFTATSSSDLYKPVSGTAKVTVNKANLTATADNKSKNYGDKNPNLSISYTGLVSGDTATSFSNPPSITTTATQNSDVGTYQITVSGGTFDNYNITFVSGTLTVNKVNIIVTADDKSKIYNEDNPSLTFQYSGFVNSENENVLTTKPSIATEAAKSSNVGSYLIIVSGGTADNYTFNYVPGKLTINKANLTVTADDKSKTVNKDNPEFTLQYSGFLNGEDESVLASKPSIYTTATKESPVGTYPIIVTGGTSDNYTFNYVSGTLTIDKAFPMLWLILGIALALIVISVAVFLFIRYRMQANRY